MIHAHCLNADIISNSLSYSHVNLDMTYCKSRWWNVGDVGGGDAVNLGLCQRGDFC